jgi:hypothetical protein
MLGGDRDHVRVYRIGLQGYLLCFRRGVVLLLERGALCLLWESMGRWRVSGRCEEYMLVEEG